MGYNTLPDNDGGGGGEGGGMDEEQGEVRRAFFLCCTRKLHWRVVCTPYGTRYADRRRRPRLYRGKL